MNGNSCAMHKTGKITETESETGSVNDDAFKKTAKVTEKEAVAIALKAHPGTVQEVEYEIEDNGDAAMKLISLMRKAWKPKSK